MSGGAVFTVDAVSSGGTVFSVSSVLSGVALVPFVSLIALVACQFRQSNQIVPYGIIDILPLNIPIICSQFHLLSIRSVASRTACQIGKCDKITECAVILSGIPPLNAASVVAEFNLSAAGTRKCRECFSVG